MPLPTMPISISFFSLFLFLPLVHALTLTSRLDLPGLFSLRASLGIKSRDWPRKADPCSQWLGVTCLSGRVVELHLSGLSRTRLGKTNPVFSVDGLRNLTSLSTFNASGFLLLGPIPAWFGSSLPAGFGVLDLDRCNVSGLIPDSLGKLGNLTKLVLSRNRLGGSIPEVLGGLQKLERLDLAGNLLNGSVPVSVWTLPELRLLDVSGNNFTGELPKEAARFNASGGVLNLSGNLYYGNISSELGRMLERLRVGDISDNYFDGQLPFDVNVTGSVSVRSNCFVGAIQQRSEADCARFYNNIWPTTSSPPLANAPTPSEGMSRNRSLVYILVGVFGGLLLVAMLVTFLACCLRSRAAGALVTRRQERGAGMDRAPPIWGSPQPIGSAVNLSVIGDSFTYDQLLQATKNFSDLNLIKHGHSGDLYLGTLESGAAVVVKRINADKISKEIYHVELDVFNRISHTRLVPLLGHCLEKEDEKLIVYKYMPYKDLSNALYRKPGLEEEGLQSLDWITRLKIATGAAEALCHLHHECSPPIVHRDIQASSILLDDKYEVRLGSLSEACMQEGDGNQNVITRLFRISQSTGASASGSMPTTCSYDVYCLGKVLLELVTGKLGISGSDNAATNEFIEQTMPCISTQEKEQLTKILDPSLIVDEDLMEEVWAMAIVAKSCLNPRASKRPQAKIILKALENPLRVIRDENAHGSARLRAVSSRGSWNAALFGSWRSSDKEMISGPPREIISSKGFETIGSQGGSVGEQSFNRRKPSKEIFPEPSYGPHDIES